VITGHVGYIPQIEIYTLMGIKERFRVPDEYKIFSNDGMDAKFLLFRLPPLNEAGYEKRFYQEGFCYGLKYVLFEYGISFVESDTLNDVRSKLWKKLFTGRNDNISHASSQSIEEDCVKNVTIKTLMDNGHFNDIYFVFCPAKRNTFQNYAFFGSEKLTVGLESTNMKDDDIVDVMIIVRP
jgi:hypothetical protein